MTSKQALAATYYRRRRAAAGVIAVVLGVLVVVAFGAWGTQPTTALQGDQLGPDGDETRAAYVERAGASLSAASEPTYALVSFAHPLKPERAAEVVAQARRMNAVIVGLAAPIAVPEPVAGASRADVISRLLGRMGAHGSPASVDAVVVWSAGEELRAIAEEPDVAAVEPAPADAPWGSFGIRPLNSAACGAAGAITPDCEERR